MISGLRIRMLGALFVATTMVVSLMSLTPPSADAAVRWTTYYKSGSSGWPEGKWKRHTVERGAYYNGGKTTAFYGEGQAQAWFGAIGLGDTSASGTVSTRFPSRNGTFGCRWTYPVSRPGIIKCELRYGN